VLIAAAVVVGRWDTIRNYWDRVTRPLSAESSNKRAVSSDTEYFCPMDPGVVSNGPARCGVCNMALVRRKRGESVMLPDGVVARMQLSPYRIQLAGIQTAPLRYLALQREWRAAALVAREPDAASLVVELPGRTAPWVKEGQVVEVACADLPGLAPLAGRIRSLARGADDGREFARATVVIDKPPDSLRGGMIAMVTFRIAMAQLDPFRTMPSDPPARRRSEPWRIYLCHEHPETIALEPGRCPIDGKSRMPQPLGDLQRLRWWCPMHPDVTSDTAGSVCEKCSRMKLRPRVVFYAPAGQVLAVPHSAVVDTGLRTVVFVESMPGVFDGIEVVLGPRSGDFYPVVSGLDPGQKVATAGAFLLDAETRLNPSLAAAYFGAARGERASDRAAATAASAAAGAEPDPGETSDALGELATADRALARRQKICPVTGRPLGSMGAPQRIDVAGRVVFLCCDGCEPALRRDPERYLAKIPPP
jgi:hypothetical protein